MTTQTGTAKAALAEALEADFSTFVDDLAALHDRAEKLQTECAGINGAAAFWKGVANILSHAGESVEKERGDVLAKLAGKPKPTMVQSVDTDLAERAKAAREEVA